VKSDSPKRPGECFLSEDDVALGTVEDSPGANAPLQGAADAAPDLGMAALDLFEHDDRPQARNALQQRNHLAVPYRGQRIRPTAAARRLLL
jgi:hypothetical protein